MTTQIVEVLRRTDQGQTFPFICRAADGEVYFVKGRSASRRGQICEWICANLGRSLGLPIPHYELVDVPKELIHSNLSIDLEDLGAGPAFGSSERAVSEITWTSAAQVKPELRRDVLAFDWWIKNGDRQLTELGGNPNLFLEVGTRDLVVLDHNLAFDQTLNKEIFLQFHIFRSDSNEVFGDFLHRDEYSRRFEDALIGWPWFVDSIPRNWLAIDEEETIPTDFDFDSTLQVLESYKEDAFWSLT